MNLFWLSRKFRRNARYHCDQHVVKMPAEAVQLLYSVLIVLLPDQAWRATAPLNKQGTARGYDIPNLNHPLAIWVRQSRTNFNLCLEYALALCKEYTRRYSKIHFVEQHANWLALNIPENLPATPMTPIPICTPDGGQATSIKKAVKIYRRAYVRDKLTFARYYHCSMPKWAIRQLKNQQA